MGLAFSAPSTLFRGDFEAGFFVLVGAFNALDFATFLWETFEYDRLNSKLVEYSTVTVILNR